MKTESPPVIIAESSEQMLMIKSTVAHEFGISLSDLIGGSRREPLPMIRHVAMALCYELIEYISLKNISDAFNCKQHQTVMHATKQTEIRCDMSSTFAARVQRTRLACKQAMKGMK